MADETEIRSLLSAAEKALEHGKRSEALALAAQAHAVAPANPDVAEAAGLVMLRGADLQQARRLVEAAVALGPATPRYRVSLAMVLRELRDADAEMQALETALSVDPYFFTANLQKGSLLELQGKHRRAASAYHAALSSLRPGMFIPAPLRPTLERAQQVVQAHFREMEQWLQTRMSAVRSEYSDVPQDRVDDCLAAFLGHKRIYNSQPTLTHFPRLPAIEFFERRDFPWLASVEAATDDIRRELVQLIELSTHEFRPYVSHAPGTPLNQWKDLNNSRAWNVLFLYKDGKPQPQNIERCPRTAALLADVPLVEIPGRAPTVFFSRLEPKTHLPAHTGATNTRVIVHLPLVIPAGCRFRVGSQVREWQPGTDRKSVV